MDLKSKIRIFEGFPNKYISFKDITSLIKDKGAFKEVIDIMAKDLKDKDVDYVVCPEARGFVIGSALAYAIGAGVILLRKPGKLPGELMRCDYLTEYGKDTLEMDASFLKEGDRVCIADDLLATGGTSDAAAKLIEKTGAEVVAMEFVIELTDLNGRDMNSEYYVNSIIQYKK